MGDRKEVPEASAYSDTGAGTGLLHRRPLRKRTKRRIRKAARRERVKEVEQVSVGANIRTRREAAGLSQGYVARLAGIPHAVLCQIERGKKDPSLHVSREIAAVLCCKLDDLLAEK